MTLQLLKVCDSQVFEGGVTLQVFESGVTSLRHIKP